MQALHTVSEELVQAVLINSPTGHDLHAVHVGSVVFVASHEPLRNSLSAQAEASVQVLQTVSVDSVQARSIN